MSFQLPPTASQERESTIIDLVKNNHSTFFLSKINSKHNDDEGIFFVFKDALKIDGIRINVSAETQQKIADMTGCMLLTAKLSDLIFMQAKIIIKPKPRPISSTTEAMIKHSQDIDNEINKLGVKDGLVSTVGKTWILDNILASKPPTTAMNYGWHYRGSFAGINGELPVCYKDMPGVRVIQGRGTAHNLLHLDYSQICQLVTRECEINGKSMDLMDVLKDPKLSYLANESGPLKLLRQSGVPNTSISIVVPDKIGI